MVVWIILNSCNSNSKMFNSLLHSDLVSLLDKAKLPQLTITLAAFHQDQVSPACPPDRLLVVLLFNSCNNNSLLTSFQALQDSRQISNLNLNNNKQASSHNSKHVFSHNNNNRHVSHHSKLVSSHSNSKHVSSHSNSKHVSSHSNS